MVPKSEEILKNAEGVLEEEGVETSSVPQNSTELLETFILPGLKNSKDTLGALYSFRTRPRSGIIGKFVSKFQNKIVNTVINVLERQSMKQQKFNELTFKAIEELKKENEELRAKIKG